MFSIASDPLLAIARLLLYALIGLMLVSGVCVVLGVPVVLVFSDQLLADLPAAAASGQAHWMIALLLASVVGMLYLAFLFFRHMLRIVNSVGEGDPFVPVNADRLTAMAWLMLAINVLVLPVLALGFHIARLVGESPGTIDAEVDFGGLILVLTLFILARVFRKGTQMREELEGTV